MSKALGEETVRKVAELARLQLSDDEVTRFTAQLGQILGYIDKLDSVDTKNVEPLIHAVDLAPALREDEARPSPGAEIMTGLAPEHLYENFKIPQVIGGGQ